VLGYFSTTNELEGENTEFPFVSFEDILSATNCFADSNLIGQGGFGKVYKVIGSCNRKRNTPNYP
jgi:hypothetical protein